MWPYQVNGYIPTRNDSLCALLYTNFRHKKQTLPKDLPIYDIISMAKLHLETKTIQT